MATNRTSLAARLIEWQRQHGRHHLPWQATRDPYRVWLSEIMLQQTQVTTVLGYYERFLARWPTVQALAGANLDDVLNAWAGLGYYARARNLHACAQRVVTRWGGHFPTSSAELATLPGVGESTAAAIAAFCFEERAAILDGNVKRVLARHYAVDADPTKTSTMRWLWDLARQNLPCASLTQAMPDAMSRYTQALMDLGATVCTRTQPLCLECPIQGSCVAYREGITHRLPARRDKRVRPTREMHLLWLSQADQVWLERRPAKGIWGGLWCLPALESEAAVQQRCKAVGVGVESLQSMAAMAHDLTHFRLILIPWAAPCPSGAQMISTEEARWVNPTDLAKLGLPKPIATLLAWHRPEITLPGAAAPDD